MTRQQDVKLESRVMINRFHWLRPFAMGQVVEFYAKRAKSWRVAFDQEVPGGGFMEDGKQCLWFSTEDLNLLDDLPGKKIVDL